MKPNKVVVLDLVREDGITYVAFEAHYNDYIRRGVMKYNTLNQKFISHNDNVYLLLMICEDIKILYQTKTR